MSCVCHKSQKWQPNDSRERDRLKRLSINREFCKVIFSEILPVLVSIRATTLFCNCHAIFLGSDPSTLYHSHFRTWGSGCRNDQFWYQWTVWQCPTKTLSLIHTHEPWQWQSSLNPQKRMMNWYSTCNVRMQCHCKDSCRSDILWYVGILIPDASSTWKDKCVKPNGNTLISHVSFDLHYISTDTLMCKDFE